MAITRNIVTDYGADNTGATDTAADFYTDLKADMAGEDCILTIPAGTYKIDSTPGGFYWASGMTSLDATATGATINGSSGAILGSFHMTQIGLSEASGKSARIRTVTAGSTTVQLTAASAAAGHISRAVIGQWMLVAGYDTQGLFLAAYGFPPNAHFFEFVQITNVGADTITFTPALQNFYSDQWPMFNAGNAFEADSGGPATVYFLHPDWDHTTTFTDGSYYRDNLIKCEGKEFTMNGGDSLSYPIYPSVNKIWRANNHTVSSGALVEADKFVDETYVDGGTYGSWQNQSSSNRYLELKNASFTNILGTAKQTVIDNCDISGELRIGCQAYGVSETLVVRNTNIDGAISATGWITTFFPSYIYPTPVGAFGMAGGIITMPISMNADVLRQLVPDAYGRNSFFWKTNAANDTGSSKVLSVTADTWPPADYQTSTTNITISNGSNILQTSDSLFTSADVGKVMVIANVGGTLKSPIIQFDSATQVRVADNFSTNLTAQSRTVQWGTCNIYVQTDDTGGFPSTKLISGYTSVGIRSNGVRSVSFENCTGSEQAEDLSQAAARNRPFASYTKRTYTGQMPTAASSGMRLSAAGAVAGTGSTVPMIGEITSLKINVITPYTGVQGTLTAGLAQFGINLNVNGTSTNFNPRVNVKIAGERVWTPGVAATGGQSGDTLPTLPVDGWCRGGVDPTLSTNVTAEYLGDTGLGPVFTIEMITDQGQVTQPTAITPLRMRLRGP